MKTIGQVLTLCCLMLCGPNAASADEAAKSIAFVDVAVVDVVAGDVLPHMSVVVSGNRIVSVQSVARFTPTDEMTVIAGEGKFLMPGMWDMHTHLIAPLPGTLKLYLANGVTGIRDLNSESFLFAWRDEIREGQRLGPRIVAAGKYFDAKLNGQPPDRKSVDTPEVARELVRERKKQGADFIKVYSGLSPEVFEAVIEEAKQNDLPVAGHCPERVSAVTASAAGQRSMEHCAGIAMSCARDEEKLREELTKAFEGPYGYDIDVAQSVVAKAMRDQDLDKQTRLFAEFKRNNTWQVPTLVVMRPLPTSEEAAESPDPRMKYIFPGFSMIWQRLLTMDALRAVRDEQYQFTKPTVRAMHAAGVPLLAGTDSGGAMGAYLFPGFSLHDELELLVECGLTPADALRTATVNPAKYFGEQETTGTVAAGMRADLVLLEANPLEQIGNVRKISGVMAAGRWLPREELDRLLNEAAKEAAGR